MFTSTGIMGWEIPPLWKTKPQPELKDLLKECPAILPRFIFSYSDFDNNLDPDQGEMESSSIKLYLPALWYTSLSSPFTFEVATHANSKIRRVNTFKLELSLMKQSFTLLSTRECSLPLPDSRSNFAALAVSSDFSCTSQYTDTSLHGTKIIMIPRGSHSQAADWTALAFTFPDDRLFRRVSLCPCSGRFVCSYELDADQSISDTRRIHVFDFL